MSAQVAALAAVLAPVALSAAAHALRRLDAAIEAMSLDPWAGID